MDDIYLEIISGLVSRIEALEAGLNELRSRESRRSAATHYDVEQNQIKPAPRLAEAPTPRAGSPMPEHVRRLVEGK